VAAHVDWREPGPALELPDEPPSGVDEGHASEPSPSAVTIYWPQGETLDDLLRAAHHQRGLPYLEPAPAVCGDPAEATSAPALTGKAATTTPPLFSGEIAPDSDRPWGSRRSARRAQAAAEVLTRGGGESTQTRSTLWVHISFASVAEK
jgi:hypothetical protein